MRLLVGCTLEKAEVDEITHGAEIRDQVKSHLLRYPLKPGNQREVEALELLAWMTGLKFAGLAPAAFGVFFVNAENPDGGGTGHTVRVCTLQGVGVATQSVWQTWART